MNYTWDQNMKYLLLERIRKSGNLKWVKKWVFGKHQTTIILGKNELGVIPHIVEIPYKNLSSTAGFAPFWYRISELCLSKVGILY